jgi:formylglycine-generating enzyme required for sulfatase activity
MGNNPSKFKGANNPVKYVSWDDCQQFLKKLNKKFRPAHSNPLLEGEWEFRLPSEAQWEYACRAGSTTRYYFGDEEGQCGEYAWYALNSGHNPHPVGEKKPNAWGLYDMHGNVCEWCQDWYDYDYYADSPADDPAGPATGSNRVHRGANGSTPAGICRSASRNGDSPELGIFCLGLRVSRVLADK